MCVYLCACVCLCVFRYNIFRCALILRDVNYCLGLQFIKLIKLPYKNTYKQISLENLYTILRLSEQMCSLEKKKKCNNE